MKDVRDSIKLNTDAIQMLLNKPAPSGRESIITFVSDTLRDMPEDWYLQVLPVITNLLLPQPQHHCSVPRLYPQDQYYPTYYTPTHHQHHP